MLPRRIVDDYRSQSLQNLQQGGLLALRSAQDLTSLYLEAIRVQTQAVQAWLSMLAGAPAPAADVEAASAAPLVEHCSALVGLLDAQLRLSGDSARSILAELQKWAPRPAEPVLCAAGLAVDAIQLPAEAVAAFIIGAARGHLSKLPSHAEALPREAAAEVPSAAVPASAAPSESPVGLPSAGAGLGVPPPAIGTSDAVPARRPRRA